MKNMRNQLYYSLLLFTIWILIIIFTKRVKAKLNNSCPYWNLSRNQIIPNSNSNNDNNNNNNSNNNFSKFRKRYNSNYSLDTFDPDGKYLKTYHLIFNYESKLFNNNELYSITNTKTFLLCNDDDIKKSDEEKENILLWNTSNIYDVSSTIVYLNVFPLWYNEQRDKGKTFCMKIDAVGWEDNVNKEICKDYEPYRDCPDLIILGTTQLAKRYYNGDTLSLNKYYTNYFKKNGKSIESMLNKYAIYDYRIDNNWLAIPLIVDFRTFRFNMTTFDYCISKGYDLHYPPPLSNYWGLNYQETWTWKKAFEYAKIITECTGKPGFRLINAKSEDTKFFVVLCQSLGIPFLVEDMNLSIKKSGFRNDEYIKKLEILRELFENHYIDSWLDEDEIKQWIKSPYPISIKDHPSFSPKAEQVNSKKFSINGMLFDILTSYEYPGVNYSYMPGGSSFLGGAGIVITKHSRYPDEIFKYIEILINEKYPYFTYLNISMTPFEKVHGSKCENDDREESKMDKCNTAVSILGTFPYYFVYDGKIHIIYLKHMGSNGFVSKISINMDSEEFLSDPELSKIFKSDAYICNYSASYDYNRIAYYDQYKLEFPLSHNETIILKSMKDYNGGFNEKQTNKKVCSIYDEYLKDAKPIQFPYNVFMEINEFENRSPISLLLAHLYYKKNTTYQGTFKDIINECCDIIDDSFLPYCKKNSKIKIGVSECHEGADTMDIIYKNCKLEENDNLPRTVECPYISHENYKGLTVEVFTILSFIIEIFFFMIIIKNRNERSMILAGFYFIISLLLSSIILDLSAYFWIGKISKSKCILKIWSMIVGITGFICSYSIKSEFIISIYHNSHITNTNTNNIKNYLFYVVSVLIEFILLVVWSFTHDGVIKKARYINGVGYYEYETCSNGNETVLGYIFVIDFIISASSIFIAFRGRNIPNEFNYSKKIFFTSLISIILLLLCYITVVVDIERNEAYMYFLALILIITLIINITFIGSNILTYLHISENTNFTIMSDDKSKLIGEGSSNIRSEMNNKDIIIIRNTGNENNNGNNINYIPVESNENYSEYNETNNYNANGGYTDNYGISEYNDNEYYINETSQHYYQEYGVYNQDNERDNYNEYNEYYENERNHNQNNFNNEYYNNNNMNRRYNY